MPEFLSKSQVQIQQVKPNRSQNLAADLSNLFGSVGKTASTYNVIGAEAAKIDLNDRMAGYNEELAQWKQASVGQDMNPDFFRAYDNRVAEISAEVVSQRSKYSGHQEAYDTFSNGALEYAVNLNTSLRPSIQQSEFTGRASIYKEDSFAKIDKAKEAGVYLSIDDIKTYTSGAKAFNQDPTVYVDKVLGNNIDNVIEQFQTSPTLFANRYGLVKDGEVNPEFYNNIVKGEFPSFASLLLEDGTLKPTADYVTNEHLEKISALLASVRKFYSSDTDAAHNPEFAALLGELKTQQQKVEAGDAPPEGLATLVKKLDTIKGTGAVAKSQLQSYDDAIETQKIVATKVNDAVQLIASLPTNELREAAANGTNGNSGYNIEANIFKGQMENMLRRADSFVMEQPSFDNYAYTYQLANRFDMKSLAIDDLDAKLYGNRQFETFKEAADLTTIANGLVKKYGISSGPRDSQEKLIYTQELASQISQISKEMPNASDKEKLNVLTSRITGIKTGGATSIALTNYDRIRGFITRIPPDEFDATFTNLGTTRLPSMSTLGAIHWRMARKGYVPSSKDQYISYVKQETTRVSFFRGKAFLMANMQVGSEKVTEDHIKNAVSFTLIKNGYSGSLSDDGVTIDQVASGDPTSPDAGTNLKIVVKYNGQELPYGRFSAEDLISLKPMKGTKAGKPIGKPKTSPYQTGSFIAP